MQCRLPRRAPRYLSPESRSFLLTTLNAGSHGDNLVEIGIEGDRADLRPVARVARPACRAALPGLGVEVAASRQDGLVFAFMALLRADVADAAVAVIEVVPVDQFSRLGPGVIQAGEALGGELRPVFCGAKQRLGIGVVVADARPRVRGLDAQPLQHRQHRRGLQRGAVVAMKHLLGVSGGDALARPRRAVCPCALRTRATLDSLPGYTPSAGSVGTLRAGAEAKRGSLATSSSTPRSARLKAWPGVGCTACALPSPAVRPC